MALPLWAFKNFSSAYDIIRIDNMYRCAWQYVNFFFFILV